MSDFLHTLVAEVFSIAGLAGLSGGSKATVRAALTPLANTLEVGLARIPFGLTPAEAEQFKSNLHVLAEVVAANANQRAHSDAMGLNKLVAQLDETV